MAPTEAVLQALKIMTEKLHALVARGVTDGIGKTGLMQRLQALPSNLNRATKPPTQMPVQETNKKNKALCAEDGCQLPVRARGLCSRHYQRQRYAERKTARILAGGDPDAASKPLIRGVGKCTSEGCEQKIYAKDLCGRHFMEWVRSKKGS